MSALDRAIDRHFWTTGELSRLRPYASMERLPHGVARRLAGEMGRTPLAVTWMISKLRRNPPADWKTEPNGAEGSKPAYVPRVAPSAAAPGSGLVAVSSQTLAAAVQARVVPCTVLPAAGAALPGPAPAVSSAAMDWAAGMLARGVRLEKLLSSAGDRLGWRERRALRAGAR
jgi:hypothetical protein